MPYKTEFVPAELFFEHNGVKIYHVYKDNDIENMVRDYHYSLVDDSDDDAYGSDNEFDIRDLQSWKDTSKTTLNFHDHVKDVLRNAIEAGEITAPEDDQA